MALSNPTVNPPRLSFTATHSLHSRSPSRSPMRPNPRDLDPLLRNLSPTATLRRFTTELDGGPGLSGGALHTASRAERALGIKAAQACVDLRSWTRELEAWEWPGSFDIPESARNRIRMSGLSLASLSAHGGADGDPDDDDPWACLPARFVKTYEARVEEIGQQLDGIDVEELKDYVLSAHMQTGSDASSVDESIGDLGAPTDLRQLDDFTALVTATILQALPYLSQLTQLLDVWTIRLNVCRSAPAYLRDLKQANTDLDHGWAAIAVSPAAGKSSGSASFNRETMAQMKSVVELQVRSLGRRLDRFLDYLEGRDETVPAFWIDDFEILEAAYGDWVVQAERKVLENEWQQNRLPLLEAAGVSAVPAAVSGRNSPTSHPREDSVRAEFNGGQPSLMQANTVSALPLKRNDDVVCSPDAHLIAVDVERPSDIIEEAQPGIAMSFGADHQVLTALPSPTRPMSRPPRHVPILIDYSRDMEAIPVQTYPDEAMHNSSKPSSFAEEEEELSPNSGVRTRAAFFNGEEAESLQKQVKSPVRPFEHASNAFTRLFKKDRTPKQQSQMRSHSSGANGDRKTHSSKGERESTFWGGKKSSNTGLSGSRLFSTDGISKKSSLASTCQSEKGVKEELSDTERPKDIATFRRAQFQDVMDLPKKSPRRHSEDSRGARLPSLMRQPPETYIPKGMTPTYQPTSLAPLLEPSTVPEFPDNWPLSSPSETAMHTPRRSSSSKRESKHKSVVNEEDPGSTSEIQPPDLPIESDAFDRMFVQSLPSSPPRQLKMRPVEKNPFHEGTWRMINSLDVQQSVEPEPTPQVHDGENQDDSTAATAASPSSPRDNSVRAATPNLTPTVPELRLEDATASPGSIDSSESAGEVREAKTIDYFHVDPSPVVSRANSVIIPARDHRRPDLRVSTSSTSFPRRPNQLGDDEGRDRSLVENASPTSTGLRPRLELKSIEISRRTSVSSTVSLPQTPGDSAPASATEARSPSVTSSSPMSYQGVLIFPTPPTGKSSLPGSPGSPIDMDQLPMSRIRDRTTALRSSVLAGREPTDQGSSTQLKTSGSLPGEGLRKPASRPSNVTPARRRALSNAQEGQSNPGEDNFDRHVSEVLDQLPGRIKFRARPGAETPVLSRRTSESRVSAGPRPKNIRVTSNHSGGMTIAPAEMSPKKSSVAAEPVKLYHLRAEGREEPIKLFVRLVGEGERVMVRVGGGWADLADYLRQYAEHHGSRTVSGSGLDLQAVDSAPGTGAGSGSGSRKVSGLTDATRPKLVAVTPLTALPAMGSKDDATPEWPRDPPSRSTPGHGPSSTDGSPVTTPAPSLHLQPTRGTLTPVPHSAPKAGSAKANSRPSTADAPSSSTSSSSRPGSRQGLNEFNPGLAPSPGLGGRASAKRAAELSEHKARWVEDMIEKAKGKPEQKGRGPEDRERAFAELGTVGATRRVVFRSTSGAAGSGANGSGGGGAEGVE